MKIGCFLVVPLSSRILQVSKCLYTSISNNIYGSFPLPDSDSDSNSDLDSKPYCYIYTVHVSTDSDSDLDPFPIVFV